MVRVVAKLHCGLDWRWKTITVIAESEEKAREIIDLKYQYRDKPYSGDEKIDSLEIKEVEELEYILEEENY